MDLNDHPVVSLDEFLLSMDSERLTPEPNDDFEIPSQSQSDATLLFESDIGDHQIHHTPNSSTDCFFTPPAHLDPSFEMMGAPSLALEPPTPLDDCFRTPNISTSARSLSQLQTTFDHTLTTPSFPNLPPNHPYGPRHLLDSSSGFLSSPLSSQNSFFGSGSTSNPDVSSFVSPLSYGQIISGRHHHRHLSGGSSLASSASSLLFEHPQVIDPSALGPPLLSSSIPIISPFINQTVEQGPDGSSTGRYQRPLTSTGRPSHARKTPPGHVKRPRNAFILFRSHACAANLIPPTVEKDHRQISRIVSHMWRDLPAAERSHWEREAEQEKELHRRLHPDYRYKPVYRKEGASKKKSSSGRRKPGNRKTPVSETSPASTADEDDPRSPMQREHERDEALRCEVVARVVMETKLSGIDLEEGQMQARVSEEIRNVQRATKNKEKKRVPAPLTQPCRKSRANSAPPPPSPIRTMHVHELVYNPKSRGSRELSPDFPKPKAPDSASSLVTGVINEHAPCWPMPSFAIHQQELQPAIFDYSSFGDLAGYELGTASTFLGDENHMDFVGFQRPLSSRRSSVLFGDMGEFPLMSIEGSSLPWGVPSGEQADSAISDLTLGLSADAQELEQFQNPFEEQERLEDRDSFEFLTSDHGRKDSLIKQIRLSDYGVTYEAL